MSERANRPDIAKRLSRPDHIDALRDWLHAELDASSNVYLESSTGPYLGRRWSHRFAISVAAHGLADLLLLRNIRALKVPEAHLTIRSIDAVGPVESRGGIARRTFVIHVEELG